MRPWWPRWCRAWTTSSGCGGESPRPRPIAAPRGRRERPRPRPHVFHQPPVIRVSENGGLKMSRTSQARTLYTTIASPVGELLLTGDGESLQGLYFHEDLRRTWIDREWTRSDRPFGDAREQLGEFFAGEREAFDLALDPAGSGFQRGVWAALSEVPTDRRSATASLHAESATGFRRAPLAARTRRTRSRS